MKRALLSTVVLLTSLVGVGCGVQRTEPSVGQLLDAPSTLHIAGQPVTVRVQPQLRQAAVQLDILMQSPSYPLSQLQVTNVYMVTTEGVWSTEVSRLSQRKCPRKCLSATVKGPANGLRAGQGVQVVVALKTAQGQTLLVKDAKGQVIGR